jgi:hypothetical protein
MNITFSTGSETRNAPSRFSPTVFMGCPVRMSGRTKTVALRDFPQSLQANVEIVPSLDYYYYYYHPNPLN